MPVIWGRIRCSVRPMERTSAAPRRTLPKAAPVFEVWRVAWHVLARGRPRGGPYRLRHAGALRHRAEAGGRMAVAAYRGRYTVGTSHGRNHRRARRPGA